MIKKVMTVPNTKPAAVLFTNEYDFMQLPDPRVVPLFGPNGAGKSTLLTAIQDESLRLNQLNIANAELEESKEDWDRHFWLNSVIESGVRFDAEGTIKVYSYFNSRDNFRHREARSLDESYDPYFLNARFDAKTLSEGQAVLYSVYELFAGLKDTEDFFNPEGPCVFLIDEFDSGVFIDNIDACMRHLKKALKQRDDIQVIFSFNNPRVLKHFPHVLSMYDNKVYELHTDDDMAALIRENSKLHEKARGRRDRLKIYA